MPGTTDLTVNVHVDTEALAAELRAIATALADAAEKIQAARDESA